MPRLNSTQAGIGAELRRHRKAQRLTLEALSERSGVSVPFISEIERGVKAPSLARLASLKRALGLAEPLQSEMSFKAAPLPDDLRAHVGACLLAAGEKGVPLVRIATVIGVDPIAIRPALRELERALAPVGIVVVDDGKTAHLATHPREAPVVRAVLAPRSPAALTPRQYEVLLIVVMLGGATHSDVRDARGVDSYEHLDHLVERRYLSKVMMADLPGRPLRYEPTPRVLDSLGFSTFEELRAELLRPYGASSWDEVRARIRDAMRAPVDGTLADATRDVDAQGADLDLSS